MASGLQLLSLNLRTTPRGRSRLRLTIRLSNSFFQSSEALRVRHTVRGYVVAGLDIGAHRAAQLRISGTRAQR